RYYDPDVGRFIVTDPIGLRGGLNLYAYALNPLGWIDPLGLRRTWCGRPQNKSTRYHEGQKPDISHQGDGRDINNHHTF
ncbi:RHS repeat-associated core domain-containing protein, partial [Escherichia marmotae]